MKTCLHQTKNSLLIGLMSFVLLFSLGQVASVKSTIPTLKIPWQTEAAHRARQVNAHHYLKLLTPERVNGFYVGYSFTALMDAHTRQASQVLTISYHPVPCDLLQAHHTYLKIAPGSEEDAHLIA